MRFSAESVASLSDSISAAPSSLLTTGNPKTAKGEGYGYLTAILHLAPHKASGFNVCGSATPGCISACLNTAGRGGFDSKIQRARIRKTKWFREDRDAFMRQLVKEIAAHVRSAEKHGLKPAVRLNGTSDIPWENVRLVGKTVFELFPNVQFYDYTKHAARFKRKLPANYDLTFSVAESNSNAADFVLKHGGRVAIVFRNAVRPNTRPKNWNLPTEYRGIPVVDADAHDLRFTEPAGVYCGLRAKGLAVKDASGFVHDVNPG